MIDWMKTYLNKGCRVLELACGTGLVSLAISPHVKELTGLDISPAMVEIARKKASLLNISNCTFLSGDAYHTGLKENAFDVIVICNALHIMMNPEEVLKNAAKLLKPDGILLASTYCHGASFCSMMLSRTASLSGFKVYHRWSPAEYAAFVKQAGYTLRDSHTVNALFPLSCLALGA